MFAIFGLGNEGKKYDNTYHNMGFLVLDALAKKHGIVFSKTKCNASFAQGVVAGKKVLLFKPKTYMNNSGLSVAQAVKKFKLNASELLVVYDDVDIPVGQVRIKQKGSAGSHNGMKSIIEHLGTQEFARVKVGIGAPFYNLTDYVLSKIAPEHNEELQIAIADAVLLVEGFILKNGIVNHVNLD